MTRKTLYRIEHRTERRPAPYDNECKGPFNQNWQGYKRDENGGYMLSPAHDYARRVTFGEGNTSYFNKFPTHWLEGLDLGIDEANGLSLACSFYTLKQLRQWFPTGWAREVMRDRWDMVVREYAVKPGHYAVGRYQAVFLSGMGVAGQVRDLVSLKVKQ